MPHRKITSLLRASGFAMLALMFAIAGSFALPAGDASAAPLAFAKGVISQAQDSDLVLIRDGCGRGMRFSNRRQTCVEDFNSGPRFVEPGCPRGMRFSNSRGHCVPMGGVDPGAAIVNGVINGLIGGGGHPNCGPGFRFSNSRGRCVPF